MLAASHKMTTTLTKRKSIALQFLLLLFRILLFLVVAVCCVPLASANGHLIVGVTHARAGSRGVSFIFGPCFPPYKMQHS